MKTQNLIFIWFLISIIISFRGVEGIKNFIGTGTTVLDWGLSTNWSPANAPVLQDTVTVSQPNVVISAQSGSVLGNSLTVGNAQNLTLDIYVNTEVTNTFEIQLNSTVNMNTLSAGTGTPTLKAKTLKIGQTSNFNNFGFLSSNADILNYGTSFNYNISKLKAFYNEGFLTSLEDIGFGIQLINNISGEIRFSGLVTMKQPAGLPVPPAGAQLMSFKGTSKAYFNAVDLLSEFDIHEVIGEAQLQLSNNSIAKFINKVQNATAIIRPMRIAGNAQYELTTNSSAFMNKYMLFIEDNATLVLGDNCYLNVSHRISFKSTSRVISHGGKMASAAPIIFLNQTTGQFEDGSIVNTPIFGLGGTAVVSFITSYLNITDGPRVDIEEVLGLNQSSQLKIDNNSIFDLFGAFIINDQAIMTVSGNSNISVFNNFTARVNTQVHFNTSLLNIRSSILFYDNSTFTSTSSDINLIDNFYFYDGSKFDIDSTGILVMGNFGLDIHSNSQISNSNVTIKGLFSNQGTLTSNSVQWDIDDKFETSKEIEVNDSNILVRNGMFTVTGSFVGRNNTITIELGSGIVDDNSTFSCENCILNILNGKYYQGVNSTISMINSTLNNNNGEIEAKGDIIVDINCNLTNSAKFLLTSNIFGPPPSNQGPLEFNNRGQFEVGPPPMGGPLAIRIPFKNNQGGQLTIKSQVAFQSLEQSGGEGNSISLENSTLSCNETIQLGSGKLKGTGEIVASLLNSGGNLGDRDIMNLQIQGNYTQTDGVMIITIDKLDSYSVINITETASLSGNLTLRVNEDLLDEQNITVVSYSQSSGTFKKINIITYNAETNEETEENCIHSTEQTSTSFSVLLNSNTKDSCITSSGEETNTSNNSSDKLSKTTIIAVVVSIGGAAVIGTVATVLFVTKYKETAVGIKLRKFVTRG
ncbi:putative transmembrane protein [Tieghemostelium lacteum]|uniref:Putative transmembrane protein n=1 Tax=Tieghemostelium lacteum TaxID=361077 RepID=A0A151ZS25_TIELA|nr:putative transmembrane protein [Tieghemostelium lacteum]|eukprot:KYQ96735.1 putative transmembrane protein [Tieghemostelium lacteum]